MTGKGWDIMSAPPVCMAPTEPVSATANGMKECGTGHRADPNISGRNQARLNSS